MVLPFILLRAVHVVLKQAAPRGVVTFLSYCNCMLCLFPLGSFPPFFLPLSSPFSCFPFFTGHPQSFRPSPFPVAPLSLVSHSSCKPTLCRLPVSCAPLGAPFPLSRAASCPHSFTLLHPPSLDSSLPLECTPFSPHAHAYTLQLHTHS